MYHRQEEMIVESECTWPVRGDWDIVGQSFAGQTLDQNALDPLEGIETNESMSVGDYGAYQNALDPLEGIETYWRNSIIPKHHLYQNALDPLEGIETQPWLY